MVMVRGAAAAHPDSIAVAIRAWPPKPAGSQRGTAVLTWATCSRNADACSGEKKGRQSRIAQRVHGKPGMDPET